MNTVRLPILDAFIADLRAIWAAEAQDQHHGGENEERRPREHLQHAPEAQQS